LSPVTKVTLHPRKTAHRFPNARYSESALGDSSPVVLQSREAQVALIEVALFSSCYGVVELSAVQ
jgi:hypothetical protein